MFSTRVQGGRGVARSYVRQSYDIVEYWTNDLIIVEYSEWEDVCGKFVSWNRVKGEYRLGQEEFLKQFKINSQSNILLIKENYINKGLN